MKKLFLVLPILTSCSVMMAANLKGTHLKSIEKATDREELIAAGASLVSSKQVGDVKIEQFRVLHKKGSIARALVNGVLDLGTAFFWELIATPIESSYDQDSYFKLLVTFDHKDQIQSIEILQDKNYSSQ
jgi:hypothetical protein